MARLRDLLGRFEQQAAHAALGKTAVEIIKGAMLVALMAGALGTPAGEETLGKGTTDNRRASLPELLEQPCLSLAQHQGGEFSNFI